MNKDDELDIAREKAHFKVSELDLIDEQIEIYESDLKIMKNDNLWEHFYKGREYCHVSNQKGRLKQIAYDEMMIKAWQSIRKKVEFVDNGGTK